MTLGKKSRIAIFNNIYDSILWKGISFAINNLLLLVYIHMQTHHISLIKTLNSLDTLFKVLDKAERSRLHEFVKRKIVIHLMQDMVIRSAE